MPASALMADDLHKWRGQFAEHLLAEYRRVSKKKGKQARRAQTAVKYEALDMLEEMGAPDSVLKLFDAMLGGVVNEWNETESARRWVSAAVDYEARATLDARDVTDTEMVDRIFLPTMPQVTSRQVALKEVHAVRQADFYRAFVLSRQSALIDEKKK